VCVIRVLGHLESKTMGCGGSSAAAGVSSPSPTLLTAGKVQAGQANDAGVKLAPGQPAIIRNCPNARLNGQRVICEEYNAGLGEWLVKGDRFPLTVGMSLGPQFLEGLPAGQAQSADIPQQAPTLRMVLEKHNAMFDGSKDHVGEFVSNVYEHAYGITLEGSGVGASGECPFASAYEVHLFYQFVLNVCVAWSEHEMGEDEELDKDFYSQMSDLCTILCFLDTDAVHLPEEIEQNIKMIQRDALFPYWVDAQINKGDDALECCVAVGQKWGLEETGAFQKALAALKK
jgi:hypothetical protein